MYIVPDARMYVTHKDGSYLGLYTGIQKWECTDLHAKVGLLENEAECTCQLDTSAGKLSGKSIALNHSANPTT